MTTIKLSGGSLGNDAVLVRCDLSQAASPVMVDYQNGDGYEHTQYQCADTRHTYNGLRDIGRWLAAQAVEVPESEFSCEDDEVEDAVEDDKGRRWAYCTDCSNYVYRIPGKRHCDGQVDSDESPVWLMVLPCDERIPANDELLPQIHCGCTH